LVVDPIKSANLSIFKINKEKIDVGAFRVFPKGHKDESLANVKDVPRRKAVDFGVHYRKYYQLQI